MDIINYVYLVHRRDHADMPGTILFYVVVYVVDHSINVTVLIETEEEEMLFILLSGELNWTF